MSFLALALHRQRPPSPAGSNLDPERKPLRGCQGQEGERAATDGFLADHVPQGLRGRIRARFSAASTAGSLVGAMVSGALYAVELGVPLLAMGVLYPLVAAALLVVPALQQMVRVVSIGHGRAG